MNEWDLLAQRLNAQRQQQAAAAAKTQAENDAVAAELQKRAGGIGGILAGIGESIGNVGNTLYDIAGTGGAAIRDLFTGNAGTGKYQNEWKQMRKEQQGDANMSDKDYYLKTGGKALDAAATVSDFIPGLGTGAKVALNVGQGAASGIARNFAENGSNVNAGDLLKSAAIGAASAGAGQAAGLGLANRAVTKPAKGAIGKALQSGIGRGAITGAVSGATGAGLGTALEGGDFGQTLSSALQGAEGGALGGATTSAIYGLAGAGLNKVKNRIENGSQSVKTQPVNVLADQEKPMTAGQRKRTTPTGWNDEDLTGAAKKQNYLQKLGGDLQDAAQATRDSAVYGKLKGNTADEMIQKDAINNLRKNYGYSPDDYEQASKLSTAINKWYDNEIQSSGAEKVNTKLSGDLALPTNNTLPEKYEKAYTETIRNALNMANAGDSDVIDKYTAGGLEKAAKYLGEQEQKMRRTNMNGVGGRPDGDRAELAEYYKNARQTLRNEVNSMIDLDDITKSNLEKMLDNAGATKQAKEAILKSKTFSEVKSATAPLEDARTMVRQIKSSGLKRSAAGDNSMNLTTQIANKTGLNNVLDVAGKPIRSVAAGTENAAGKAISTIGNAVAGENPSIPGKVVGGVANAVKTVNQGLNVGDADYGFSDTPGKTAVGRAVRKVFSGNGPLTVGDLATRQIARQAGQSEANANRTAQQVLEAQNALSEAKAAYDTANNNLVAAQQASAAMSQGAQQLDRIRNAMELALSAGDITAYGQLADLYTQAAKMYGTTTTANATSNLSSSQIENLNKLDTAGNAIDELEALFQKAGGGQGLIGGNAANFMASLGLNSDVATYNSISRGLINQIGAAIGKTDSLNTEGEVNRALELIPKFTDDAQTAQNKLEQLRQMLATNKQTVYQNYGLTQ